MKKLQILAVGAVAVLFAGAFAACTDDKKDDIEITEGGLEVKKTVAVTGFSVNWENDQYVDTFFDEKPSGTFQTGGTYVYSNEELTLTSMAPGDGVKLNLTFENKSNISIKYQIVLSCKEGNLLYNALAFTVDGNALTAADGRAATAWSELVAPNAAIPAAEIVVRLPIEVGTEVQGKSCTIGVTFVAVQGNAAV